METLTTVCIAPSPSSRLFLGDFDSRLAAYLANPTETERQAVVFMTSLALKTMPKGKPSPRVARLLRTARGVGIDRALNIAF